MKVKTIIPFACRFVKPELTFCKFGSYKTYMKCIPGEKLMLLAAGLAAAISKNEEGEEILAMADFFGMVAANLIAIADRKLYFEDPNNKCKTKK